MEQNFSSTFLKRIGLDQISPANQLTNSDKFNLDSSNKIQKANFEISEQFIDEIKYLEKEIEGLTKDRNEMETRFMRYEQEDKNLRDEIERLRSELQVKSK